MYLQKKTFSLFMKTIQLDDRNAICMSCSCHKDKLCGFSSSLKKPTQN